MSEEVELARQWAAKAANDLLSADNNMKAEAGEVLGWLRATLPSLFP